MENLLDSRSIFRARQSLVGAMATSTRCGAARAAEAVMRKGGELRPRWPGRLTATGKSSCPVRSQRRRTVLRDATRMN
jgi:hypothetical protein